MCREEKPFTALRSLDGKVGDERRTEEVPGLGGEARGSAAAGQRERDPWKLEAAHLLGSA